MILFRLPYCRIPMFEEHPIVVPSVSRDVPVLYRVGKSAAGNDQLLTLASPHDIWFHVDGCPSAHVVVECGGVALTRKQNHDLVVQGAVLCKRHSKQKSASRVPVLYAVVGRVRKTDVLGTVVVEGKVGTYVV
jgi:predicted ribosome quality control (RQC) complex YloA/Tae2 family protein